MPTSKDQGRVKPLSQRLLEDMIARRLPLQIQRRYMDAVAGFVGYYKQHPPGRLNADHVTAYLLQLAVTEKLPLSEQKTVVCGLRFFYGVTLRKEWAQQLGVVIPEPADGSLERRASVIVVSAPGLRLRERMVEDMLLRGLSPQTHRKYLHAVADFVKFHGSTPPGQLGPEHVKAYQLHLIRDRNLANKTVTVAVCALRFLYRVTLNKAWALERIVYGKRTRHLPDVPSPEGVSQLLASTLHLRHRVMLSTAYAAGLRRAEVAALRVQDIDAKQHIIRVVEGKGKKDRLVMLSPALLLLIREYIKAAKPNHWLFPGQKLGTHVCGDTVALACHQAWKRSGQENPITVRQLRHAFATRLMEMGTPPAVIQQLMGHAHLRTTQIYVHVAAKTIASTPSPFDLLPTPPSQS